MKKDKVRFLEERIKHYDHMSIIMEEASNSNKNALELAIEYKQMADDFRDLLNKHKIVKNKNYEI